MKDAPPRTTLLLDADAPTERVKNAARVAPHDEPNAPETSALTSEDFSTSSETTAQIVDAEKRASRNPRLASWLIVAAVIAATLLVVALLFRHRAETKEKVNESLNAEEQSSASVALSPEQRANIALEIVQPHAVTTDVTAPGKIAFNGNRLTPVFSQFNGRLVKLNVETNQTIRAGAVIGEIETPDIISAQSDFQQAVANERTARTAFDLARRTRERAERLASAEAIPQRDLQQAQADEARAKDDVSRAHDLIEATRAKLLSAGMNEKEIAQLAAGARPAGRTLPLTAPIGGTVIERKAGLGQVVQAGAGDPLLVIADLSTVWVNADVYEDQLSKIRLGALVKIQTSAYPNETFAARVDQIGSLVDPDKHTIAVRCVVANAGGRLKPNMFANVILNSAVTQNVLTVPASAIVTEGAKRIVFVEENGKFTKREIETGGETNGAVIVKSGLKEGERVVTRGGLLIANEEQ